MLDTINAFITKLTNTTFDGDCLMLDERHRIQIVPLENGNARFDYASLIAGQWELLTTVELEVGRHFWSGVVQIIRARTGMRFTLPDKIVAGGIVATLPGAEVFLEDRPIEKPAPPKKKTKLKTTTSRTAAT